MTFNRSNFPGKAPHLYIRIQLRLSTERLRPLFLKPNRFIKLSLQHTHTHPDPGTQSKNSQKKEWEKHLRLFLNLSLNTCSARGRNKMKSKECDERSFTRAMGYVGR